MDTLGTHLLVEFFGCSRDQLVDRHGIEKLLSDSAENGKATVVAVRSRELVPNGLDSIAILKESHLALRTYPDSGYATADVYTCGDCDPYGCLAVIKERLAAQDVDIVAIERGMPGDEPTRVRGHRSSKRILVDCTVANIPPNVFVDQSPGRGVGLFAKKDFERGEVIYDAPISLASFDTQFVLRSEEYETILMADDIGMELSIAALKEFPPELLEKLAAHYGLQDPALNVLRYRMTNGRQDEVLVTGFDGLVNHSDNANTLSQLSPQDLGFENDTPKMVMSLIAASPIQAGDELFWDYREIPGYVPPANWLS